MVTQITLGNISNIGGRTVVGGGQSGIDTEALIKGLTEARRLPAVRLETRNENLDKQKSALSELQSLITRFRTSVDALRNPPGVQNDTQNIFQYRTTTLSSIVNAANYVNVTVEPGVNVQNLSIDEVVQLARETKQESSVLSLPSNTSPAVAAAGDATPGRLSAGTFNLRVLDGGANAAITLAENDSLQTVANKFNAVRDRTGIQATVVKVANGSPNSDFKIIFTATQTGTTGAFDLANAGTVTSDPDGVLAQLGFNTTQPAQNAQFVFDGVTIERESNSVDDLIDGITITLKQPLPATSPIGISVQPDTSLVKNALVEFVDLYNELRVFAANQSEIGDDGLPTEDAVLINDPALRSIVNSVSAEVGRVISGLTAGQPDRLSDIGFGFQDFAGDDENPAVRNIIALDEEKLQSALEANFDAVRGIFEFRQTSDNPNLAIFRRTNALNTNAFTLNIDRTNGIYTATVGTSTFTVDVEVVSPTLLSIKGPAGSVLEGMEFLYSSADDATINVNVSQGIGDRLFNYFEASLRPGDGLLSNAITTIEDQKTRNTTEITKIDTFIERYREQLIEQYSALEAALSAANQLLSLLDAQASARNNA